MANLDKLSPTSVGRAGEFLTAYKFEMAGLETIHSNTSCDLHVTLPSKRVLRVEVKSSLKPWRSGSFRFRRGKSDAQIFVFACLPLNLIRVFSGYMLRDYKLVTLRPSEFTEQAEADDIASLFLR